MVEALLIVMGGLLGSAHCVGMCGGFVLTLGSMQSNWRRNLQRQLTYCTGRICVYTLGGAIAGFGGGQLGKEVSAVNLQAGLAILAGMLLIIQGLFSAGLIRMSWRGEANGCPSAGAFATLLRARSIGVVFTAGIVNGLLPCGLVYAYLALASSTGEMLHGAAIMALFGLGTIPSMTLTGLSGSVLGLSKRRLILRIATVCMIVTGMIAIARGVAFYTTTEETGNTCPYCH